MLNIAHRQTTAYHPEANGVVKRLHCRLKDALKARAAAANWSEEIHWVLLGLRAQQVFHLLSQFLAVLLCFQMNFCKMMKLLLRIFVKNLLPQ